jgi:hypothetical protein
MLKMGYFTLSKLGRKEHMILVAFSFLFTMNIAMSNLSLYVLFPKLRSVKYFVKYSTNSRLLRQISCFARFLPNHSQYCTSIYRPHLSSLVFKNIRDRHISIINPNRRGRWNVYCGGLPLLLAGADRHDFGCGFSSGEGMS